MADQTVTPENVFTSLSKPTGQLTAAAAIEQGDVIAKGTTATQAILASAAVEASAAAKIPIGVALNAGATGQPIDYAGPDADFTTGFTVTEGEIYVLSDTPGKFCLPSDLGEGMPAIVLGVGKADNTINFKPVIGGTIGGSDVTPPTVSTFSPVDNATGVSTVANLVITFSEAVIAQSAKNIVIKKTSDDTTVATIAVTGGQVSGSGTDTITVNPTAALAATTQFYVLIDAGAFKDAAGNAYAGQASTTLWSFTTGASSAASSETPTSLSGNTTPVQRFSAATFAATADSTAISTWTALTGANATQTGTARPTKQVLGDFNVLRFDGVNDEMRFSEVAGLGDFTIVAVLKKATGIGIVLGSAGGDQAEQLLSATSATAGCYCYDREDPNVQIDSDAMDLTSLAIVTLRVASNVAAFTFNGTSAGGGSGFGLTVPLTASVIGATDPAGGSPAGFCAMDLAELILFDSAISDLTTPTTGVVAKLKAHYGIL